MEATWNVVTERSNGGLQKDIRRFLLTYTLGTGTNLRMVWDTSKAFARDYFNLL